MLNARTQGWTELWIDGSGLLYGRVQAAFDATDLNLQQIVDMHIAEQELLLPDRMCVSICKEGVWSVADSNAIVAACYYAHQ